MAVNIKLKRSAVPGNVPTTSQLELGEIALNTYDGKAFFKKDDGTIQSIVELASTGSTVASASYALYAATAGTASVALNAISSSYALSSSYSATATSASYAVSASVSSTTISSSYATSASYADTSSYANNFNVSGNLVVGGDITAKTLHVQTVTSSIIYSSGSNIFGDATNDTQTLIGTVNISGSLNVTGAAVINNLTGSLYGTASWALDAVTAINAPRYTLTSSFQNFTQSYYADSASVSTRVTNLEQFSASILNYTASTDAKIDSLYLATSSLNAFSASILSYTASTDAKIASIYNATSSLQSSTASLNAFSASILNYTSSTDAKIASIYNATASLQSATESLNAQTASLLNYTASNNANIASLNAQTASLLLATASLNAFSASMLAFTASYGTGSFTGSFKGNFTGSFSGSLNNLQGTARHIPFFSSSQILDDSSIYQVGTESVAINQNAVTTAAPEALYVWQPSTSSYNVISGKGNLDNYLQLNIQNVNQGPSASSDVVATANNGTETTNYIDMGINSENFSGFLGGPNDAYVYAAGNEFHIGNITPNKHLGFFVGGGDVDTGNKFALYPNNQHQMTGSLDVSGSIKAFSFTGSLSGSVTGSLFGTASWANNATSASYAFNATSASHAVTASSADDFLVRGTLTAQTIIAQVITSSVSFITGSTKFGTITSNTHQFTGSVSVSGSLAVNNSNVILTNQTSSMSVLSSSYALTSSYAAVAASGTGSFTGSFIGTVTGSLLGTASRADNATSASFATIASFATSAESADFATSASFASTASFASRGNGSFSGSFSGSFFGSGAGLTNISASSVVGLNLAQITSGSVTASVDPNGFKVNSNATISGSTQITGSLGVTGSVNISGSGTVLSANVDAISFTGSFAQLGSVTVVGSINATSFTGSLLGTSSFAVSASQTQNAVSSSFASTASFVTLAQTASFVTLAQTASFVTTAQTASFVQNAQTASFALTASSADNFLVRGTLTAQTINVQTITSSVDFVTGSTRFGTLTSNTHQFTGSVSVSGSLAVNGSDVVLTNQTSSMSVLSSSFASTASFVQNAQTASFVQNAQTASYVENAQTASFVTLAQTASFVTLAQTASFVQNAQTASFVTLAQTASFVQTAQTASYILNAVSASYALNADLLDGKDSTTFATTGSNVFRGNQTVTGSLFTSGSNNLVGSTTLTGSLLVSGSTTQTGNNTLIGNTTLSGSIIISGSTGPGAATASVQIYGDIRQSGYHRFDPVTTNIDTTVSASYIYVSGSTQDLYFSQNGNGYSNVTRLRWLEGNLYTGLLNGGLITAATGSTTYQISSGSGIIVSLNASLADNPYPTIKYINWPNLSASIASLSSSYDQSFVSIDSNGQIFTQGAPYSDGQFNTEIPIGVVLHQNRSTINGVQTFPSLAYGWKQRSSDFIRAFGPLKLSGLDIYPSSSRGLTVGSGTAWSDGRNYSIDPNNPSYITDPGTSVSKIFRYRQSGSAAWVYDTNGGAGYTTIDPTQYSNSGSLASVGAGNWSIQRVYFFPNSATKAIYVYYGNAVYATETEAIANLQFEPFVEAPNTAAQAVYLGAIVINGTGVFTTSNDYKILPAGLFRSIGGTGGGGSSVTSTLAGLSDVSISGPTSGQALVYNSTSNKWENKSFISASISGNAATATSASLAATASFVVLAQTASYVENAQTASFVQTAQTASFVTLAQTASFVQTAQTASFVQTAQTASYVLNAISSSFAATASTATSATRASTVSISGISTNAEYSFPLILTGSSGPSIGLNNDTVSGFTYNPSTNLFRIFNLQATGSLLGTSSFADNATTSSLALTASSADNFLVRGTLTAQTIVAQTITSSIDFVTGSTRFGTLLSNTHQFTGSVSITGSLAINGSNVILANQTSSMSVLSSSFANNATSASYALSASYAFNATSASFADNTTSASYALSASYAFNATSASHALTSSYSNNILGATNYIAKFSGSNSLTSSIMFENATGIGVNDVVPTHRFQVNGDTLIYNSNSTLNTTKYALLPTLNITTIGTETNQWANVGIYGSLGFSATASTFTPRDNSFVSAFLGNVVKSGAGSVSGKMSSYAAASNFSGTGNVTTVAGFRAYAPLQSFAQPTFTGTVTNYIGLLIDDITGTTDIGSKVTNKYGIYQSGSLDRNYFAGATIFANGLTGSLEGTASYAVTASYAMNAGSGGGGGLSALYIQDEGVTQGTASYIDFTGAGVTATVTGGTASIAITGGGGGGGGAQTFTQAAPAISWSFSHNLGTYTPLVQVYDSSYNTIQPASIVGTSLNATTITFATATSGYAIISTGGSINITGSNVILSQTVAASTWSFNHGLNEKYPVFTVFDNNDDVIIPLRINAVNANTALIYFSSPRTGTAVAANCGVSGSFATSSFAVSASFASTASFVQNAQTASYVLNAISASHALTASSADNFTVRGTLTAQTIVVQTITSSTDFVTGSTRFGTLSSNTHQFTGSVSVSGSLDVNGSNVVLTNQTSSMSVLSAQTASFVQTAQTASFVQTAQTASYVLNAVSASFASTASFVTLAQTASFVQTAQTASYVLNAVSASFATNATTAQTASFATNFTVASTLTLDATLTDYASVASSIVGSNNLFTLNTGSYTSAFFRYTVANGANTRAGEVIAAWNGTTTTITDFSTVDIGDTSAVTASVSIVSGQAQFNIQTNSSGWRLKSIGTFM